MLNRARSLVNENKIEMALQVYEELLRELQQQNDKKLLADVALEVSTLLMNLENYDKATELSKLAADIFKELNDDSDLANALYNLSISLMNTGRASDAVDYINQATELFKKSNDMQAYADALYAKGLIYYEIEENEKALEALQQAVKIYKKQGNDDALVSIYQDIASVLADLGDMTKARKFIKEAIAVADKIGDPSLIADIYTNSGELEELNDNLKKACEDYIKAAELYADAGMYEAALEILDRAESYLNDLPKATAKRLRNKIWDMQEEYKKKVDNKKETK